MKNYSISSFKRSILRYVTGRLINAVMAFSVFIWIARLLPTQEYANYVAAFAILEISLVIFGFGMEWVTSVFIPEARIKAKTQILRRFVWHCAAIQSAFLSAGAAILFLSAPFLAHELGMQDAVQVFRLYSIVMLVEGISRVFRDQLLSSLLLQGAAQFSQLGRNIVMVGFVWVLFDQPQWHTASALALAELCASSISFALSALLLQRYLMASLDEKNHDEHWQLPTWTSMLRAGRNAWLSNLTNLSWGGQAIILIVTRMLGTETTATLGFARNLSEQIRRYMPMEFMLGIVRTLLLVRFLQEKDTNKLALRAGLMYRANLLFILPLLALSITRGDELCAALSDGKYASAHWMLVGWLSVLVFWAHHRLSDLLAHVLKRSELTIRSSLALLVTPVFISTAIYFESWIALFLMLAIAETVYSIFVLTPLAIYRLNLMDLGKLMFATALAVAALSVPAWPTGASSLVIQAGVAFIIVAGVAMLTRAWSSMEASLLFPDKESSHAI